MANCCDVAIIGAGLIGASAACSLSECCETVLIEQEAQPGYHSSGRSAAVLIPSYGGPITRALTAASIGALSHPPSSFSQHPLTSPRGAIFLATENQLSLLDRWNPTGMSSAQNLSAAEAVKYVPILKPERIAAALLLPDVQDIDAAALLQSYLKAFKTCGGTLLLNSTVEAIRYVDGMWYIQTTSGAVHSKIVLNAAGAWADNIADLAGVERRGLTPMRRTMAVISAPSGLDVRHWPLVGDAAETFYFKPEGARLVVSPADHSPIVAQDVQPDELDVAIAVDRLEAATNLKVRRVEHQWAGLRTRTPDDEPIIGFDLTAPAFVWAAGFAGFGVQTSPAAGRCCAALICDKSLPSELSKHGVDLKQLSPLRLTSPAGSRA